MERKRCALAWAPGGKAAVTGALKWHYGRQICDPGSVLADKPSLADAADALFLGVSDKSTFSTPAKATVSAADAARHITRLFPGATLIVAPPSQMRLNAKAMPFACRGTNEFAVSIPAPGESSRYVCLTTTNEGGKEIRVAHLLHALAYYVLVVAADLRQNVPNRLDGLCSNVTASSLLRALPHYYQMAKDRGTIRLTIDEIFEVAAFFGGYALAYYLELDARCMSHYMLEEECKNPRLKGLIDSYIGDLGWVVGHPKALANFLSHHSGTTRAEWQDHANEAFRIAIVNRMADALLRYQAPLLPNTLPDAGLEWLPEEEAAATGRVAEVEDALLELSQSVYDTLFPLVMEAINTEVPYPTTYFPVLVSDEDAFSLGEAFVLPANIKRSLAYEQEQLSNPNCLFVAKVAQDRPSDRHSAQVSLTPAIRFSFFSLYINAEALCKATPATQSLVQGNLSKWLGLPFQIVWPAL